MWWLIAVVAVVLLGAALWGPIVSNVEQAKYQLVESSGNIEIREYAPMIVAEAEVSGDRRDADMTLGRDTQTRGARQAPPQS